MIMLIFGFCAFQRSAFGQTNGLPPYSPTPTDWMLGGGDPSSVFGMRLIEATDQTNASATISIRPVLSFDAKLHDGYNEAFYGLYATDSLTNSWSALHGWWADGSHIDYVDMADKPQRFYILTTVQMVVVDTLPKTPKELGYSPPSVPSEPPTPGSGTVSTNNLGGL